MMNEQALRFGLLDSIPTILRIPGARLFPIKTRFSHCVFSLKRQGATVHFALLVRTVDTTTYRQDFVMIADEQNRVFLVRRFEVTGNDLVLLVSQEDGNAMPLSIPLSKLRPECTARFQEFLSLECVRNLAAQQFDELPEGLFEPVAIFQRGNERL